MSRPRVSRRLSAVPAVAGLALLLAGCAKNAPQDSLQPRSHYARTIYHLIVPVFAVAGVVLAIVLLGTLYMAVRFRVRSDLPLEGEEIPPQVHGSRKLEIGWTVLPALILLVVGFFTVLSIMKLAERPPKGSPRIEVIGQQWWWEFRYDVNHDGKYDEVVTADELVIPAGTDIDLRMSSRDVIHGFWAPRLNGKRDVVPGHPTDFNIAADSPGEYFGQCTVMCGLSHANMRFKVIALSKADYAKWLVDQQKPAAEPTTDLAKKGKEAFNQCAACHEIRGVNKVDPNAIDQVAKAAPDLTHLMSRTIFASGNFDLRKNTAECRAQGINWDVKTCLNSAELRAWLADPPAMLPMYSNGIPGKPGTRRGMPNLNLSPSQLDELVAYLSTLK